VEDNGLEKPWFGNVWLNPPYASDLIGKFADKLVDELKHIKQAIVLVNNATETEWFYTMVVQATAVCFPRSRVRFVTPDGTTGAPLQGQAILYFGPDVNRFINVFDEKGWCARV
jgi:ParB family chromosome partitioning protein